MGGRKTYLTEDCHTRIVQACRAGAYLKDAAQYGGISERLLYDWLTRGRQYDEQLDEPEGAVVEGEDIYRKLYLEVDKARADARISAVTTIRKAWQNDNVWQAAAWYLERTDPQNWGRVQRVELAGRDGGAIQVADVTDQERRLSESLRARLGQAASQSRAISAPDDADVIDVESEESGAPVKAPIVTYVTSDPDDEDYPYAYPVDPSGDFDF